MLIRIEVTFTIDISLIKDLVNLILTQIVQPSPTAILVYFEGPSDLVELDERLNITIDIEIGE